VRGRGGAPGTAHLGTRFPAAPTRQGIVPRASPPSSPWLRPSNRQQTRGLRVRSEGRRFPTSRAVIPQSRALSGRSAGLDRLRKKAAQPCHPETWLLGRRICILCFQANADSSAPAGASE
jgi:hypothetical protein